MQKSNLTRKISEPDGCAKHVARPFEGRFRIALGNSVTGWGFVTHILWWALAFMIFLHLGMSTYIVDFEKDLTSGFQLTQIHKSFGFVSFVLALHQVAWIWHNKGSPTLPAAMSRWQILASQISRKMSYVLLHWMPISTWLEASASPLNNANA